MTLTAFVSHSDCSRHDTGWKHPEHQGRLPGLARAVYRDMLILHDCLLEVEARPATEEDLLLVHTPRLVREVRDAVARAERAGEPVPLSQQTVVSGASWDAALASAGTALTGAEAVLSGRVRNAFCAARPPGRGALPDAVGGYALFNNVAITARHLRQRHGVGRVLIVEWGGTVPPALNEIFAGDAAIGIVSVQQATGAPGALSAGAHVVTLPAGSGGDLYISAFEAVMADALRAGAPDFILISAGFDALSTDPVGELALDPPDFYHLTRHVVEQAELWCGGRVVSVLEGGYDPAGLGKSVVQHLRALAELPSH
ncbi:histone deacetylase family protein [soil metagenome]